METLRLGDNFRVPQFYNYTPYPGTELFDALKREGVPVPDPAGGLGRPRL